jgi:gamma-glutamyltranspeptidase/glutathione hydrolase/leukotriene-C4 hydrolase
MAILTFLSQISKRAIPGELKGYEEAHRRFGKLPWRDLFEPTIELCENGFPVSSSLAYALHYDQAKIKKNKQLAEILIDPETNSVYKQGNVIKLRKLANTLRLISEHGAKEFYNGSLTNKILREINENGGQVTAEDIHDYTVKVDENRFVVSLDENYRVYANAPPSSGLLIAFVLKLVRNYVHESMHEFESVEVFHHRLVEILKHTYAQRSFLGDEDYLDLDEVTFFKESTHF